MQEGVPESGGLALRLQWCPSVSRGGRAKCPLLSLHLTEREGPILREIDVEGPATPRIFWCWV
eukprot:2074617-Alexandrium_andersonii.AAC.1